MNDDKLVGKDHAFWDYFDHGKGGVGNHEAAAVLYAAELIYTGLSELKTSLDDLRTTINNLNRPLHKETQKKEAK